MTSKILANRLKHVLSKEIDKRQSTFLSRRGMLGSIFLLLIN